MINRVFRVFGVLILVAAVTGGGYWFWQQRTATTSTGSATEVYTQIVTVSEGSISATVSVVGQLSAPQSQEMTFERLDGTTSLMSLLVAAGNDVQAGQVLAEIDPTPYEQALDQAESDLQEAIAALSDLQTPATALQLAQADLAVVQAELSLHQAEDDLDSLTDPDLASLQSDVADARLSLTEAQADLAEVQADQADDDTLSKLWDTESDYAVEYSRLAAESYSDAYYQDRLRLANNALLTAQDARKTQEINLQISLFNAQSKVRKAQQTLAQAQQDLAAAAAGPDELTLAKAQHAVAKAELAVAQANADRADLEAGPDALSLSLAQAQVTDAQQAVTDAQADLVAAQIIAPFDGTILETFTSEGRRITSSSSILTIAYLGELQVVASIDETTIRQIEPGQSVSISFDAYPGQQFSGEVLAVPLQGELQGDVMVYEVPMSLTGAEDLPLLVGMTANAAIATGSADNALLVPSMAVVNYGNSYQVLIPGSGEDAQPSAVTVDVGLTNGTYTQILDGLAVGDQVLVEMSNSTTSNFRFGGGQSGLSGLTGGIRVPRN
ncbi:MAG: efflux RND transporter periplasmic adaptor subunit [Caldilineaceae bacterium]